MRIGASATIAIPALLLFVAAAGAQVLDLPRSDAAPTAIEEIEVEPSTAELRQQAEDRLEDRIAEREAMQLGPELLDNAAPGDTGSVFTDDFSPGADNMPVFAGDEPSCLTDMQAARYWSSENQLCLGRTLATFTSTGTTTTRDAACALARPDVGLDLSECSCTSAPASFPGLTDWTCTRTYRWWTEDES